jgi:tricarboxylate carrier
MVSGVATVCAGGLLVKHLDDEPCPDFRLSAEGVPRYNKSTFLGRFKGNLFGMSPLLLFKTEEQFRDMEKEVKAALASDRVFTEEENSRLWDAKELVDSAIHPDTGLIVPHPFRMSGYVPFNGPISVAMVASGSTPALLFWGWINQSQNALVNYFNRNASSQMSDETLMLSYAGAVAAAMTIGFGMATFIQRKFEPSKAKRLLTFVAFPSSVIASSLNCYIVRSPEIDTGIPLLMKDGTVVKGPSGIDLPPSKIAAARGVYETTASRAMLQCPVYGIPPLVMSTIFATTIAANPAMATPIATYTLLIAFGVGLPAAVAVFPQIREIQVDDLEVEYRHLKDAKGDAIKTLYFNRGQ